MEVKDKNIIVYGLGVTGISSIKALSQLGANIYVYSDQIDDKFHETIELNKEYITGFFESVDDIDWQPIDLLLKSPGIKMDRPIILAAEKANVDVITDIELAYRLWPELKIISLTGTNGKTTTTSLISHLLFTGGIKNKVVGNIGIGILQEIMEYGKDYVYVCEVSSFQLAASKTFRTKWACILNIREDHLDWHGSLESYVDAKLQLTKNQNEDDLVILNHDDQYYDLTVSSTKAHIRSISTSQELEEGIYCLDNDVFIDNVKTNLKRDNLHLVGKHNTQNMLFAIEIARAFNLDEDTIIKGLESFKAIEHRVEPVKTIKGVQYINDSKGTNVDSTVNALLGFKEPVILLAGGYDKKANYKPLFTTGANIKCFILLGATKFDIAEECENFDQDFIIVENLEEAVTLAKDISMEKDIVLFSPACASWDMYHDYEERGRHFKELVCGIE